MISIIVPAYNAEKTLAECLDALLAQSLPRDRYEVIVVDDGSTDRTAEIATRYPVRVVRRARNAGPAAARNRGVREAHGEIVLFTDADCVPSTQWIARMVAPFAEPDVVGVKGTYRTTQRSLIARLVQLEFEIRYRRMSMFPQIDFIDTYSAAYRRSHLIDCGGFDATFSAPSVEDVDLSFRLAGMGCRLLFVPDAWVEHRHPVSLWAYLARKARYGYWRSVIYLRYPDKMGGDAHTDPWLKYQFALVALLLGVTLAAVWRRVLLGASLALLFCFAGTTFSFVRWAWQRDRAVALVWPVVTLLRVLVQGGGLAVGLVWHLLVKWFGRL